MKRLRNSKGFTLIELMVTLGLLGLVVVGGINLYFFADRSFFTGSIVADVQADVQIAMKQISEEIRLAHTMELETKLPVNIEDKDEHFLYVYEGSIILQTMQGKQVLLKGDSSRTTYGIEFRRAQKDGETLDNVLNVTVSAKNPKVDYSLDADLQILNLRLAKIEGQDGAKIIRFTKAFSPKELEQAEIIQPGCIFRRHVYTSDPSKLDQLRAFRDDRLAKSPAGRFVIRFYYFSSPIVSSLLDRLPITRYTTCAVLRSVAELVI